MQVGFLGPLEVVVDGHVVDIGGARLRALLIRLALDAGRTVSVDALSDALWPHNVPADRANALQTLVSRLRRALSGTSALRFVPGGYSLDLPPEAVDALRFERLAREGRRALRDGEPRAAAGLWRTTSIMLTSATTVVSPNPGPLMATEAGLEPAVSAYCCRCAGSSYRSPIEAAVLATRPMVITIHAGSRIRSRRSARRTSVPVPASAITGHPPQAGWHGAGPRPR